MLEVLREGEQDDRYLSRREKIARASTMLPMTFTALVWVSVRPFLALPTALALGLLIAWFLLNLALIAGVAVRTRRRARARRRRVEKAARLAARSPTRPRARDEFDRGRASQAREATGTDPGCAS